MIRIWSFYIKQAISFIEKRDLKDVQEITMKLLENCNTIVASSLEQTKWLRKNLQVRSVPSDLTSINGDSTNENLLIDDSTPINNDGNFFSFF